MSPRPRSASAPAGSAPPTAAADPVTEEVIAGAVVGCPGVAALSAGPFAEVATYLPGRRIVGVRMDRDTVEIHVIVHWGTPLPAVAEQVRAACVSFAGGRRVDVTIDDIVAEAPQPAGEGSRTPSRAPHPPTTATG